MARSFTPFHRSSLFFSLTLAAMPIGGCAHDKSAEDRQLDALRDEIARVQSESDKFEERLGKLEVDSADVRPEGAGVKDATPPPARTNSTPSIATPSLRVVHLGTDGTEEAGAADETAGAVATPEVDEGPPIRITGNGSEATIVTDKGERTDKSGKSRHATDATTSTANTTFFTNANLGPSLATHSGARPSALDEEAKHAYDGALAQVNAKHYAEALDSFAGFLVKWPDHPNADNAMYWRGECYFAQGDYVSAGHEFEGLLARFPMGNKAPDALLKLGLSELKTDDASLARQRFDRLRREFPHSDAAKHIPAGAQTVRTDSGGKP
jgi:tol-pal system protein YbgF